MSYEEEDRCHMRRRIHVSMSCSRDSLARFALTNTYYTITNYILYNDKLYII
jgi:hypothetical protein